MKAESKIEKREPTYVELEFDECRILRPEKLPFAESRFRLADNRLWRCDWETFKFAIDDGLIVAVACDDEGRGRLTACAQYEFDDVETYYDKKSGMLFIRSAKKG
jgi:hypothetical protein